MHLSVGNSVPLHATLSPDITGIKWQPVTGLSCSNCATPVASPRQTTTYTVYATNEGGCIGQDKMTIFVFCDNANLFMPDLFSPNGDGQNDSFYPRGRGLFTIKTLRIFNRWGEVVFERSGFRPNEELMGWNGQHNGQPAPTGVYVYTIGVVCENGAQMNYGGNVMLLR
jgi:gliding motility-associated-like protein